MFIVFGLLIHRACGMANPVYKHGLWLCKTRIVHKSGICKCIEKANDIGLVAVGHLDTICHQRIECGRLDNACTIMLEHCIERSKATIVHIRHCERHIPERWYTELVQIVSVVGDVCPATIVDRRIDTKTYVTERIICK